MTTKETLRLGAEASSGSGRLRAVLGRRTDWRAIILLVVVGVVALVKEPLVFTAYSVTLNLVALTGLVALGLTAVIIMGELDLSVASTLAVSGVIMASIPSVALGIIVALCAGLVIGLINAFFVVKVGINSFIATLGMLFVLRGLAFVLSNEKPVPMTNIDAGIAFGRPLIGPITPRLLLFVLAFICLQVFLSRVRAGREFYAVGGNRQAARDAGIPVSRRMVTGFMLSGFVAAAAGVINTMELTAADPTAGGTVLLASFAAAIVGGVALTGGRGSVVGTLIGALSLGIIAVGLTFTGVQVDVQQIFIGGVLFLAVVTDPAAVRGVAARARLFFQDRRQPQTQTQTQTQS